MNPFNTLTAELERLHEEHLALAETPFEAGWLDHGLPSDDGPYPCLRYSGLFDVLDKQGSRQVNLKLWHNDLSEDFFALAEAWRDALSNSDVLQCEGYVHQPDEGLNCALFTVRFIP